MIPKSGRRFSDKIVPYELSMIWKKPAPDLIRGGCRFLINRDNTTLQNGLIPRAADAS
jgi:hypothetical protein